MIFFHVTVEIPNLLYRYLYAARNADTAIMTDFSSSVGAKIRFE